MEEEDDDDDDQEEEGEGEAPELSPESLRAALDLVRRLRSRDPKLVLDLDGASLRGFDLRGMDLRVATLRNADFADADLRGAILTEVDLTRSNFSKTLLQEADLAGARMVGTNIYGTYLYRANLQNCDLTYAMIVGAGCREADFSGATLMAANLIVVDMKGASLRGANFLFTALNGVELNDAHFEGAEFSFTVLAGCHLAGATGLGKVVHDGPSSIDGQTMRNSGGADLEPFLRGCGLEDWEIVQAGLYEPLSTIDIKSICSKIVDARLKGRSMRLFISYSHLDSKFVSKLHKRLSSAGFNVWFDKHELGAGSLQEQIRGALVEQEVVVVVLSCNSVESDWVENELEMARNREKGERKNLLCPIAIDGAWEKKLRDENNPSYALWRTLREKYVVDFSGWNTKKFNVAFDQLVSGIRRNYGPAHSEKVLRG